MNRWVMVIGLWVALSLNAGASANSYNAGLELRPMDARGDPEASQFALMLASEAHMEVTGPIVRVTVKQTFQNTTDQWVEGLYRFPLAEDSAVDGFTMLVGDRRITGIIKEKQEARRTYERAAARGQRAALMVEHRPNIFSNRVANIAPGGELAVEFTYQSLARLRGSVFLWDMPTVILPRFHGPQNPGDAYSGEDSAQVMDRLHYVVGNNQSPVGGITLTANWAGADAIQGVASNIEAFEVERDGATWRANVDAEAMPRNKDLHFAWALDQTDETRTWLFTEKSGRDTYALALFVPAKTRIVPSLQPLRDITFILDTSGSMYGDPINAAKTTIRTALQSLRPGDHFNIMAFAGNRSNLFSSSQPATEENIGHAEAFMGSFTGSGGTVMAGPLEEAIGAPGKPGLQRQIMFVTDGAISREMDVFKLMASELEWRDGTDKPRIFTVGVGASPNDWFLRKTAEVGRGTYLQLPRGAIEAGPIQTLEQDMRSPRLLDITASAGMDYVAPGPIPDLFGNRAIYITARLSPGTAPLELSAREVDGQTWSASLSRNDAVEGAGISKLWARRQIDRHTDERIFGRDQEAVRADILSLALEHSLLSAYTSFVAVEEKVVRPNNEDLAKAHVKSPLPEGVKAERVFGPAGSSGWKADLVLALILLLSGVLLVLYRPVRVPVRERLR